MMLRALLRRDAMEERITVAEAKELLANLREKDVCRVYGAYAVHDKDWDHAYSLGSARKLVGHANGEGWSGTHEAYRRLLFRRHTHTLTLHRSDETITLSYGVRP